MAAETTGFLIDGKHYEVPTLDTFTVDEAQVLYDYARLTIEDFVLADDDDDGDKAKNPGFLRALMHVAYQRGNPTVKPVRVRQLIGQANVLDAIEAMYASVAAKLEEEGDAVPPASTSEPAGSSPKSSLERPSSETQQHEPNGNGSLTSSDGPGSDPASTGGSRSATPSISAREISAA